jgi:hypothetical protein
MCSLSLSHSLFFFSSLASRAHSVSSFYPYISSISVQFLCLSVQFLFLSLSLSSQYSFFSLSLFSQLFFHDCFMHSARATTDRWQAIKLDQTVSSRNRTDRDPRWFLKLLIYLLDTKVMYCKNPCIWGFLGTETGPWPCLSKWVASFGPGVLLCFAYHLAETEIK